MQQIVRDAIELYYHVKDHNAYLQRCREPLVIADELLRIARDFAPIVYTLGERVSPALEFQADFGKFRRDAFKVEFSSSLLISKIAKVFSVLHSFQVENRHDQPIEPVLAGDSGVPYIGKQFELHERISETLLEFGYTELELADMDEVVPELSFPEGVTIFGRQVSVECALFRDVMLGLCAREMDLIE